jgi:dienelactone hydrolase
MKRALVLLLGLLACQACTSSRVLLPSGQPSGVLVEYFPAESQPAPTVLVAHGCSGVDAHHTSWARTLNSWGYNAAVVDSFSGRGFSTVCDRSHLVNPALRAADLVLVARDVRAQPWHRGKIGAVGFSHGGSTMLALADRNRYQPWASDFLDEAQPTPIVAIVSYYPGCVAVGPPLHPDMPVMIHFAMKDDWTPPSQCGWFPGTQKFADSRYAVHAYPNARHTFDRTGPRRNYLGYVLEYDGEADRAAAERTREFFARLLQP